MIEAVHPVLAVGLVTLNGTNVVRFTIVIPSDDLDNIDRAAIGDDSLPAFVVQVVVRHVDPLKTMVKREGEMEECWSVRTFLLKESGP